MLEKLIEIVGTKNVLSQEQVSERATSYWDSTPMLAKALVTPHTTKQVSKVLEVCYNENQPVITHGGRTGCVKGTHSGLEDIVLSLEKMNRIEEIDEAGMTITLEAGCVLEAVQNRVADRGLFLPLDLGARGSCTIGGNLATNAGGMNVIRYGMSRAITLGLEAVLPDGCMISSMNRMLKNNAGFDLKQLFIGTEGSLGVITRAVLKLEPQSQTCNTALAALETFADVPKLLNHMKSSVGASLSGFEIMWGDYFRAVTEPGWHRAPMKRTYPFYILFECKGSDPARDDERFMEVIKTAFDAGIIVDAVLPKSEQERKAIWGIRDNFEAILQSDPVYLYDVSLPIGDMETYVGNVTASLKDALPTAVLHTIGHVGDGNLHFFVQAGTEADKAREHADRSVYLPLKEFGGSVSAEHGIGFEKKRWLSQCRSQDEIALMQTLKRSLDPKGLLNPGIVVD